MAEEFELKYDCLIEILSRLPVKSLIRFTCVSKGWLSLIRSPEFITKHHDFHHNSHHQSVLALFTSGCSISLFSDQNHNQNLSFQTAFKFRPAVVYDPPQYQIYHRDIIQDCSIVGPCNGLFLISLVKGFSHVLLLWNPATREVFKLPDNSHFTCCLIHGFGFDTVNHDYKVVGLYAHIEGIIDNTVVCLYSLATNSWTRLYHAYDDVCTQYDVPYMRVSPFGNGSSSNGRMHNWISSHYHLGALRHCLLSFDMVDEVFVQTPLPPDAVSAPLGLLSHGSKYPRVFSFGDTNHLHIWVLQAYGPTGVWNKLLDINFPESEWRPTAYAALWNNNSQFVFSPYGTLISFNLTTKQMTSLGIPVDTDLTSYTESLVPIAKSVGQQPPIIRHSHHLDQQQHFQFQQQHDDDDSDDSSSSSSVDSAFVTPDITAFNDFNTVYIDYETDLEIYRRRKNEVDRLSNLPYCLREVNHPMVSNPCTF